MTVLLLWPFSVAAIQFHSYVQGPYVDVVVSDIELPMDQLNKDLGSGLTTVIVAHLTVIKKQTVHTKNQQEVRIRFDLWDEVYNVDQAPPITASAPATANRKFKLKEEVLKIIGTYRFNQILRTSDFGNGEDIRVTFSMIVDPISKDKKQKIKRWLAQNRVGASSSSTATGDSTPAAADPLGSGTKNRSLFGQILDSEFSSDITTGQWVFTSPVTALSPPVSNVGGANEK